MLGVALFRVIRELCRGVWLEWQRVPMVVQIGKGLAEELRCRGVVETLHSDICRSQDIWISHRIAHYLVPDVLVVLGVGVGGYLVTEVVVVWYILAERATEPLVVAGILWALLVLLLTTTWLQWLRNTLLAFISYTFATF